MGGHEKLTQKNLVDKNKSNISITLDTHDTDWDHAINSLGFQLENAFTDKNANDYKKNFSSGQPLVDRDFYFLPSSNVAPYFPPDWNIGSEFQYFNNLVITVPENNPINVSFTNEEYDVQGDSAIYSSTYSISVPVLNSVPIIYGGSTKFIMITDQNSVWVIYYWEDIAQQGFKSWSELKYEFSQ